MERATRGNVFSARGRWYVRVWLGKGKRPAYQLPTCSDEAQANERGLVLAELAEMLRVAGHGELAPQYLQRAAAAQTDRTLAIVRGAVEQICKVRLEPVAERAAVTFESFAKRWTSGELAETFRDHVRAKRSFERDEQMLAQHINPIVGHIPLEAFTLDHALDVLKSLSSDLEASTRRQIAKCMARVLSLAHWPARLIPANPIPRGFSPKDGPEKMRMWIFPDEDAQLLACPAVPLFRRVYYGFQAREGMRPTEGRLLAWGDLDLERGTVRLEINKTDDPRLFPLDAGVVRALRRWKEFRERELDRRVEDMELVFCDLDGEPMNRPNLAAVFRDHLRVAGITRAELFKSTPTRRAVRVHDLRATFITLALAHNKTETWVSDRTGHSSSREIQRYRRAARTAAELGMPELPPLVEAIPEFGSAPPAAGAGGLARGNAVATLVAGGRSRSRTAPQIPDESTRDDPARPIRSTSGTACRGRGRCGAGGARA